MELAKKHGVPTESLAEFMVFLALFNGAGAPTASLYYTIAQVYAQPDLKARLRRELEGLSGHELLHNELLEHVFCESTRMNAVPRFYFKKAQQDFDMPVAAGGGGKSVPIRKGSLVLIPTVLSHRDPTVFKDPHSFDPSRYEVDPSLKDKVFSHGTSKNSKNGFGCAAGKAGLAQWVWKNMFATFLAHVDFDFVQSPRFNHNAFYSFEPKNLILEHIAVDGKKSSFPDDAETSALTKRFFAMADLVRNKEVKFRRHEYLKLYGLYKQAMYGDNNTPKPGLSTGFASEKWAHHSRVRGMSKQEAMKCYIGMVDGDATKGVDGKDPVSVQDAPGAPQEADQVQIQVTPSGSATTLHQATFGFHADTRDIDTALELDIAMHDEEGLVAQIKVSLPQSIDCTRLEKAVSLPLARKPQVLYLSIPSTDDSFGSVFLKEIRFSLDDGDCGLLYRFPHYRVVPVPNPQTILFEASSHVPNEENPILRKARLDYVEQMQDLYQWESRQALPGELDSSYLNLPVSDQFVEKGFTSLPADSFEREQAGSFDFFLQPLTSHHRPVPRLAMSDLWKEDVEFGRLFLQGTHCNFIQRCRKLPKGLRLDESFVPAGGDSTLRDLMTQQRLFVCDYHILEGVCPPDGRYLTAPIVLFYSDVAKNELLPVAIQIERDDTAPVFTPLDAESDWLFAKMWARVADIAVHQLASHFLLTHSVLEAFTVAANRTFATNHPLYQLLVPHFKTTLGINALAREALLNKGGWIDRFFSFAGSVQESVQQKAFEAISLRTCMNLPRDLERRGVSQADSLPEYPYRDDGLLIWETIAKYVDGFVSIFYSSDALVENDESLQKWTSEFEKHGYTQSDWGAIHTRHDLQDLLTSLIFTATAMHGSMNSPQYEVYGFVPASPGAMYSPPPREKNVITAEDILKALPGKETLEIYRFLSQDFDEDVKLGRHTEIFSSHPDMRQVLWDFRQDLRNVECEIDKRNQVRTVPYSAMLPSKIPNSVDL